MKIIFASLFIGAVAFGEAAVAPKSGSWGDTGSYQRLYRAGTAATVRGNVLSTGQFLPEDGGEPGVQLQLATEGGELTIHLGPRWFVMENDLNFSHGEPLTIVGVKIRFDKKPVVVASRVVRDKRNIILREPATGKPKWDATSAKGPTN